MAESKHLPMSWRGIALASTETYSDAACASTLPQTSTAHDAISDVIKEGERHSYGLEGRVYDVTIRSVSPSLASNALEILMSINGELFDGLQAGDTDITQDGLDLRIRDIFLDEAGDWPQPYLVGFDLVAADR